MRRLTIVLLGVAVTIVALAGSNALGQDTDRFRVLLGALIFLDSDEDPHSPMETWEILPVPFTATVQAPNEGIRKNVPCELILLADPFEFGQATFSLSCPGLSVCSAHGPNATIDQEFTFGGDEETFPSGIAEEQLFENFFGGASPADPRPQDFFLPGRPLFGCGTVLGRTSLWTATHLLPGILSVRPI
jgi:hypothetical protein